MLIPQFDVIEASRIRLRHFTDSDLPAFLAYRNDSEVARYQSWDAISETEAHDFIQEQKTRQLGTPGQWFQIAIELKEKGTLIGDCGLKIFEDDAQQAELGFTLAREYQGKGLAFEAIAKVLDYVFGVLALHRVIAIADCENTASVALLERLGMRREGHFIQNIWFKGKWGDEYLYAILREERKKA